MASVEPTIASTVATADSAKSAWYALHTTYANKSQTRVFSLRDQLSRVTKDSRSITEYPQYSIPFGWVSHCWCSCVQSWTHSQNIKWSGAWVSRDICARDTTISFEELFEKLLDNELCHKDAKKLSSPITAAVAIPTKTNTNNRRQTTNSQQWRQNSQPNTPPQWQSNSNPNGVTRCQLCNRIGHTTPMFAARSLTITLKPKPTMQPGLLLPPTPG